MQLTLPSGYIFEQYELRLHSGVQNPLQQKENAVTCSAATISVHTRRTS